MYLKSMLTNELMILNVNRNELLNIIQGCCGVPVDSIDDCITKNRIYKHKIANTESLYVWRRDYLEALSDSNLVEFYKKHKKK